MPVLQLATLDCGSNVRRGMLIAASVVMVAIVPETVQAASSWDSQELTAGEVPGPAGSGTQWWFDPFNWTGDNGDPGDDPPYFLPPTSNGTAVTDTEISANTSTLPGGEGVVYYPQQQDETHPDGDPNFLAAAGLAYPDGYGRQVIRELYIARRTTNHSKLTIKGDLTVGVGGNSTAFQIGRSGSRPDPDNPGQVIQNLGHIVQVAGKVLVPTANLDIGQREPPVAANPTANPPVLANPLNWGNGIYDYRGGILDVYNNMTNHGIRLSSGSAGNGTGGHGRFIAHNPTTPGYVRTYDFIVAADRNSGDGVLTGVGIAEFHFENGGTRPIQVARNLSINNGPDSQVTTAVRSSRLELVLNEAPAVDELGVPEHIGLFDVSFVTVLNGTIQGTGNLDGENPLNDNAFSNDRVFSSGDASKDYYPRSEWNRATLADRDEEDFLLEAVFGNTLYRWEVSYTGLITWEGTVGVDYGNSGVVASVAGTGGNDVVLIGHSSVTLDLGLTGDYNADGAVDAADYVLWRHGGPLENEGHNEGVVDENDYGVWTANFGDAEGGGSSSSTGIVPEPCAMLLAMVAAIGAGFVRRKR